MTSLEKMGGSWSDRRLLMSAVYAELHTFSKCLSSCSFVCPSSFLMAANMEIYCKGSSCFFTPSTVSSLLYFNSSVGVP